MKIALPVNDTTQKTTICQSFGRAPFFLVYDSETEEKTYITNDATTNQGGAGIKAAQNVVDSQAEVILTPRCGENAAQVIQAAGIKLYKTINDSVQDNITAFNAGRLKLLEEVHAGFNGRGGQ